MIPAHMQNFLPMLAVQSNKIAPKVGDAITQLHNSGKYLFDLKWDGVRAVAYVIDGTVQLINRRQVDITFRYPDIVAALLDTYGNQMRILDGEIIVWGANGQPDFAAIHRRDAQANVRSAEALVAQFPATFMAFDVLGYSNDDTRPMPLVARRALLLKDKSRFAKVRAVDWSMSDTDGETLWKFVCDHGLEGLIAKTKSGPYKSGRQQSWIKLKQTERITAIGRSYTAGKGKRANGVGAVVMELLPADLDATNCVGIGEVGTGFDDPELILVKQRIDAGGFVLMDVEIQNMHKPQPGFPFGKARFPAFKGFRDDVHVTDAHVGQLDGIPVI